MPLQLKAQPYPDGPAVLKGFNATALREFVLGAENALFDLRLLLSCAKFLLPYSYLRIGGPHEITRLSFRPCLYRLITCISGSGFALIQDCRPHAQTHGQPTIFKMLPSREEAIFIPEGFAFGYIFESQNSLFVEFSSFSKNEHSFLINPFDIDTPFAISIGVPRDRLKLVNL